MTPNISGINMMVGRTAEPTKISGGQKPYYIGATAGVKPSLLDDGTVYLEAVAPTITAGSGGSSSSDTGSGSSNSCASGSSSGTNYVWIQDSSYPQNSVQFNICVDSAPTLTSSLGSGAATMTLSPGDSQTFVMLGGIAPYMAVSSNTAIASVSGSSASGSITVTAGQTTGNATITVLDAYGSSYTVSVQVTPGTSTAGLTLYPGKLTGMVGNTLALNIDGGTAPYTVVSSDPNVATATVNGSSVSVKLVQTGAISLIVHDAANATATATVTVTGGVVGLSPATLTGAMGNIKALSIVGGTGPYTVISSNPNVATASINGSLVTVSMINDGSATITITDANNTTASATVSVSRGFAIVPPFQLMPEFSVIQTPVTINFSVLNGQSMGPYYVSMPATAPGTTIPTTSLITVSPMSFMGGSSMPLMTLTVTLQASTLVTDSNGNEGKIVCIKSDKTIPITVTDSVTGLTATAIVQIQNTDPSNDGFPGCL
jgi:hypothetical protein